MAENEAKNTMQSVAKDAAGDAVVNDASGNDTKDVAKAVAKDTTKSISKDAKNKKLKKVSKKSLKTMRKNRRRHPVRNKARIVKYGTSGFVRNIWLSTAATVVMAITLIILFVTIVASVILTSTAELMKDKIDITIYLKPNTSEETLAELNGIISKDKNIKSVDVSTSEQEYDKFLQENGVAEVIAQRHQEHIAPEEPGLLPVLVQEQACPAGGEGNRLMRSLTRILREASPRGARPRGAPSYTRHGLTRLVGGKPSPREPGVLWATREFFQRQGFSSLAPVLPWTLHRTSQFSMPMSVLQTIKMCEGSPGLPHQALQSLLFHPHSFISLLPTEQLGIHSPAGL